MKLLKTVFLALLTLMLASQALGQGGVAFYYIPEGTPVPRALTDSCGFIGAPIPDGTLIAMYWDNNNNGPDATDVPVPQGADCYGCAEITTFPMNGTAAGIGAGYFYFENYFYVGNMPEAPDVARYYARISTPHACWYTDSYELQPGGAWDWILTEDDLHSCVAGPCPTDIDPPAAPTAVAATDNTLCERIRVQWTHDGQNVNSFNVYSGTTSVATASASERVAEFFIQDDQPHAYTVKAVNLGGESAASNADNGSSYLVRFATGAAGNVTGWNRATRRDTIFFDYPGDGMCNAGLKLWLLDSTNTRRGLLASDSLTDSLVFTLPALSNFSAARILLVDSSFDRFNVFYTDTTDSVFHLGPIPSAADERNLVNPDRFDLAQNYPNPFNPTTNIVFSVPRQAEVKLVVYNLLGQAVRTLVAGQYAAGVHHVAWDGRSDAGTQVGAGLYLYRLEGPGFQMTKKMLLMK